MLQTATKYNKAPHPINSKFLNESAKAISSRFVGYANQIMGPYSDMELGEKQSLIVGLMMVDQRIRVNHFNTLLGQETMDVKRFIALEKPIKIDDEIDDDEEEYDEEQLEEDPVDLWLDKMTEYYSSWLMSDIEELKKHTLDKNLSGKLYKILQINYDKIDEAVSERSMPTGLVQVAGGIVLAALLSKSLKKKN
jgi:hypothetical protein